MRRSPIDNEAGSNPRTPPPEGLPPLLHADNRLLVFEFLEAELLAELEPAVADITNLKEIGDVYALSLIIPKLEKKFGGIDIYDAAVGDVAQDLKSSLFKADISAGRKFYRYIEKLGKSEAKSKRPRGDRAVKSIQKSLGKIVDENPNSIYGKAAKLAAEELGTIEKSVAEPRDYIRRAAMKR